MKEGDYVLAIDGEDLTASDNPYRLLRNKADRPVQDDRQYQARDRRAPGPSRSSRSPPRPTSVISPTSRATANRVNRLSDGRVGYIHIPNMGAEGIREFIKWYYPQIRKEGMVVDVRYNGGGNVSQMLIERLQARAAGHGLLPDQRHAHDLPIARSSTATWSAS